MLDTPTELEEQKALIAAEVDAFSEKVGTEDSAITDEDLRAILKTDQEPRLHMTEADLRAIKESEWIGPR